METRNKVFINRRFKCSVAALFNWLIQPELIAQWFGPKHYSVGSVQTDVRVGGKYAIELRNPDSQNFLIEGEYIEVNAPHALVFTFHYKGLPTLPPKSIVKIKLEALAPNESILYLTQDFVFTPLDIENRAKAWEHMFQVLGEQIRTVANRDD